MAGSIFQARSTARRFPTYRVPDASKGNILEIIIEAPSKAETDGVGATPLSRMIRLATRLLLERGLGTSSWSEKHVDVRPIKLSELPARGEPAAREGNLSALDRAGTVSGAIRICHERNRQGFERV